MKVAKWWNSIDDMTVECTLCPNHCVINDGNIGRCGVRYCENGTLFSLTDGNYISEAVDPIEKKPLYNFNRGDFVYSIGTAGCNLDCQFCQNWQLVRVPVEILERYKTDDEDIIKRTLSSKSQGIAFTYNEPTVNWEQMYRLSKLAKENGLYTVAVSNGYLEEEPMIEMCSVIDAWNIDLKGMDKSFYKNICGGERDVVIRNIGIASKHSHVEVTCLLIDGQNTDPHQVEELAKTISLINPNITLHLSRYFPNYKMKIPPTSLESIRKARDISLRYLPNVFVGNCVLNE